MKRLPSALLLVTLALPAFLDIREDHNWGDDFAMYIMEAKNIATGRPLAAVHFLYDDETRGDGPRAYPVGFPLMLAPVYRLYGLSFRHFHYLTSTWAALLSVLTFLYLRGKGSSRAGAFAVAAVLAFNPWLIVLKDSVIADLPFAVFVLLAVMAVERERPIVSGLAMGAALTIRSAGVPLLLAIALYWLYDSIWKSRPERPAKPLWALAVTTVLIAVGVRIVVDWAFPSPPATDASYFSILRPMSAWKGVVMGNLSYYVDLPQEFVEAFRWVFLIKALTIALVWCSTVGLLRRIKAGLRFSEIFVLSYLAMILIWPNAQGFRYLLPVVPMLLDCVRTEVSELNGVLLGRWSRYGAAALALAVPLAFAPYLGELHQRRQQMREGPMTVEARQAYSEIQRSTPPDARFIAYKPRALALFTDRRAAFAVPALPPDAFRAFVRRNGIHYELLDLGSGLVRNGEYKTQIPPDIRPVDLWSNGRYLILELDWQ